MDLIISFAIWWAPVLALLIFLQLSGKGAVAWPWVGAAMAAFAAYSAAVFLLPQFGWFPHIPGSPYNWTGKIAAILCTLAMILAATRASPVMTNEALGLTLRQNAGSVRPALLATAAMVATVVALQLLAADGPQADLETLAYQATIPGIDEELLFRGLLLALLATAIGQMRHQWHWAGILVTMLFALGHSFFYSAQGSQFDPIALAYTAVLGGLMMFIRLRTGSILLPLIAHNLTNVVNKLV